ncbi:MAG: DUF3052 domain-containing protein [Austwickia sp.]|nr:DUF3052 domain-containing protein [Austwickia sp.]
MDGVNGVNTPAAGGPSGLPKLGFSAGQVVQEYGYDDDVDHDFRYAVEDVIGSELEYDDFTGVADGVLLWWRDGDGDLVDALVDVLTNLAEGAGIVVLTPKAGRVGEVDAAEIEESAVTAGLHATANVSIGSDWSASRLLAPKSSRR